MYEKIQTREERLYMMDIRRMNFNQEKTIEDLNRKGKIMNLMPMLSQNEEKHHRAKKKRLGIESATNTFTL
jgi:hypothetical protein